jgi:uncharacterized protein YfaS (alpha-2-macroglobulin family)
VGVPDGEVDYDARWRDRQNPCRSAYYLHGYNSEVQAQRNLMVSNLGLLAKSDAHGRLMVTVTNLASAEARSGVTLELRNFQNQPIGSGTSDATAWPPLNRPARHSCWWQTAAPIGAICAWAMAMRCR